MKPQFLLVISLLLVMTLFGSSQAQATPSRPLSAPESRQPGSLFFTFKVPALQIPQEGATALPAIEGYQVSGAPGDPLLPTRAYNIALPPDVIPASVQAQVLAVQATDLDGAYQVAPAPPGQVKIDNRQVQVWGKNAASIQDGQNSLVYQNNAFFPQSQLTGVRFDQMRKWRFVTLLLTPLQYNPVTGKLRLSSEVQVQVTYERASSVDLQQQHIELSDTVADARAAELLFNYDQARAWYPLMPKPAGLTTTYNYVIITSKNIVAASKSLNSFVAHKQAQGYSVLVVTEDQYGVAQYGSQRASKIRQWLIDNYLAQSIQYVLLVGDPTPYIPGTIVGNVGDVPMRMCWPAHYFYDKNGNSIGEKIPTDYLYANLTGNWDLDTKGLNDQYCGELDDDEGAGGMSFFPDVSVGRIPVYQNVPDWWKTLDSILEKTIIYEDSAYVTWRKRALLPMSFSDATTDGAYLAEAMKTGYLNAAGYESYTLYQRFLYWGPGVGTCYSNFSSNQNLLSGAVVDHWKNKAYGVVTWHAHGGIDATGIGYSACSLGNLISSAEAATLNKYTLPGKYPAIVFSASCYNGYPENADNLGYSLLKNGAIAVISSARMSGYYFGEFSPDMSAGGNADLAYYVTQGVVNGLKVGDALYNNKYLMSLAGDLSPTKAVNLIDFNLYGDPSLGINDGHLGKPSIPTGLTAAAVVGGIKLAWTDTSDNEDGFFVQRMENPAGAWESHLSPVMNMTELVDDGPLTCGTHYSYRIFSWNIDGYLGYSNTADAWAANLDDFESDNTRSAAKSITPTGSGSTGQYHNFDNAADVDWVKFNATKNKLYTISTSSLGVSNDTALELYDASGQYLGVSNDNCGAGVLFSCITDWPAPATGVFYLKVYNPNSEGGCTGYQYDLTVKEGGWADFPPQPTSLNASSVSHCQIDLAWNDNSSNEDGFEVQRLGWKGSPGGYGMYLWQQIATVGAGVNHYHDSGLECSKQYSYRVRAYNVNGKSFFSNDSLATTQIADAYEGDNVSGTAKTITIGTPQVRNFHIAGDVDWVKFTASAGQVYTITTSNLGASNDTWLYLYDQNKTTLLAQNDDCAGVESCIKKWAAPASGDYYVRVENFQHEGGCPGYQYTLAVKSASNGTLLSKPSSLAIWDKSVSNLSLSWPDPDSTPHAFKVERWLVITGTQGIWQQMGIAGPGMLFRSTTDDAGSARPTDGYAGFNDTNLTCNTAYLYRVSAFDELGDSPYSEVFSATTLLTDTFEPDNDFTFAHTIYVNSAAQNHNLGAGADVDWTSFSAQAGEVYTITTSQFTHSDSYSPTLALYRDPLGASLATTQSCGADSKALCINGWSAPITDTYFIKVSGQGGCPGHDYYLSVVNSHQSLDWPAPPTSFTGTLTLPDQIDLTWAYTSGTASGFRLERLVGAGWLQLANLGLHIGYYSDAGLACGQPYQYRLYAYNDYGNSTIVTLDPISTPPCVYPIPGYPLYMPIVRR